MWGHRVKVKIAWARCLISFCTPFNFNVKGGCICKLQFYARHDFQGSFSTNTRENRDCEQSIKLAYEDRKTELRFGQIVSFNISLIPPFLMFFITF